MGRRSSRGRNRKQDSSGGSLPADRMDFEFVHELHRDRIFNYCYRFLGDFHLAEEVTQETFLRLHRNFESLEGDVSPWLYRVASNLAKNAARDRRRRPLTGVEEEVIQQVSDPSLRPRLAAQRRELEGVVSRILESIPARYREVLLLCDLQDLSYDEAARVLGISRGSVGVRLYRARRLAARKFGRERYRWE